MRIVTLKVPDVEVDRWDLEAKRAGVKRSEWIRRRCGQNGHVPDLIPNVPQTAAVDTSTRNLPPAVAASVSRDIATASGKTLDEAADILRRATRQVTPHPKPSSAKKPAHR